MLSFSLSKSFFSFLKRFFCCYVIILRIKKIVRIIVDSVIIPRQNHLMEVSFMSFFVNTFFSSLFKKSRSFLKRFMISFLAIIIAFNFVCKPKEVNAMTIELFLLIWAGVTGTVVAGAAAVEAYNNWRDKNNEEDDFDTYFNKNITVDGSGNYVISDAGTVTINAMQEELKEMDTYTYGYIPRAANLSSESFRTSQAYEFCKALITYNPGYMFCPVTGVNVSHTSWGAVPGVRVVIVENPYAGVGQPTDFIGNIIVCYNESWTQAYTYREVYIFDHGSNDSITGMYYFDSDNVRHEIASVEDLVANGLDLTEIRSVNQSDGLGVEMYPAKRAFSQVTLSPGNNRYFSNYSGGIPVFNSLAALKKGLDDCTKMEYMPGYTGQPVTKNTVTQTEINDFSATYNYYYGDSSGGSGSGGSGSGSSGNWIDTIVNGIGSFFDGALQIIGKIIEALGKFMILIADAFSDLSEVMPTGFINFLSQLFPFIPEEWITAATLFLSLALLGVLIKIFGK